MAKNATKTAKQLAADDGTSPRRLTEGLMITFLCLSLYLLIALATYDTCDPGYSTTGTGACVENISNSAGKAGAVLADILFWAFGYLAFLFPFMVAYRAIIVFQKAHRGISGWNWPVVGLRVAGFLLVFTAGCGLWSIHFHAAPDTLPKEVTAGGIIGQLVSDFSVNAFNIVGSTLILVAIFLIGMTVFADVSWIRVSEETGRLALAFFDRIRTQIEHVKRKRREEKEVRQIQEERKAVFEKETKKIEKKKPPKITAPVKKVEKSERVQKEKQQTLFTDTAPGELPKLSLLDEADKDAAGGYSEETLESMSRLLEKKLKDFNVDAEVTAVQPGPVVTRFEIQPAAGVKVSKITNLAKDLARSLAVISVRVVEVIPGKTVVGIEIPNEDREMIRFSEVVSSREFDKSSSPLSLALGKDISGNPVVADLGKMPHLLVAGTTGSGKSVGLNSMLMSILFKAGPESVRLIMIDPKMLELAVYDGIPHLLTPVVTDMKEAASALRWGVGEMERRYRLMAALGVRNLAGFNKKVEEAQKAGSPIKDPLWTVQDDALTEEAPDLQKLPYIVIVIDEFADMMMIVGKKVEELIARIAQKARAAGIHLILATQRPSVDVITGLIKANVPSRMAFQVSSKIDSRTVLDQGGAEQLLGHGDMLFLPAGSSVPERVHGAFVADDEVHRVCDDWRQRGEPDYLDEILDDSIDLNAGSLLPTGDDEDSEQDALYDQAVAFVTETRRVSISSVQRKFKIGYNRAARLVEAMEMAGVVSAAQSNGSREVIAPPPVKA